MDTHIQPDPDSNVSRPIHVSLPDDVLDRERGHPEGEAGDVMDAPTASPAERLSPAEVQRPRRRRGVLLGTAASVLLLGVGAAYVFSPDNTAYPVPRMASTLRHLAKEAGIGQPPVLAPSAHLAKVNAPPLPPPATRETYTPVPRKSEVDEILALRGGAPSGAAVRDAAPPRHAAPDVINSGPTEVPGEPGGPAISSNPATIATQQASLPSKPVVAPPSPDPKPDLTQSIVAGMRDHDGTNSNLTAPAQSALAGSPTTIPAAEPQKLAAAAPLVQPQQQPQPSSATAAPVLQADAATAAANLQAAPMSTPDQVQVLELVTRLGTLVADQRKEVEQLRADLARSRIDETARIDDFQRRLTFAEAQRSIAKASGGTAETVPMPTPAASPAPDAATSVVRPTLVVARAALPADPSQAVQRYRVQAASPGLAMLAAIDRAGDESAQLQVALGDTVPGYGRVKAVVQQGTTWVVKTEHGTIGQ
jgi:hypothetical protein